VEFRFPDDYLPAVAAVAGFELAPGATTVVKARWPADHVPPPGTHACWLASVFTRLDTPVAGRPVWEHNNLAQKNLAVVHLVPGDWFLLPFVLNRFASERWPLTWSAGPRRVSACWVGWRWTSGSGRTTDLRCSTFAEPDPTGCRELCQGL
jgi:hypothetical protein